MIRVMLDSDQLASLPSGMVPLLSTYSDLIPDLAALAALQRQHPGSEIILIDRGTGDPTGLASVADVEPGALTVAGLPAWFARKTAAKIDDLTVYSDRADLDAIDAVLKGTGHEGHWRWVATLDGTVDITGMPPLRRPAVVQILGSGQLGLHADLSLVLEPGWHR